MSITKVFKTTLLILMTTIASLSADTVRYLGAELSNTVLTSSASTGKVVYASPGEVILGNADFTSHRPLYAYEYCQVLVGMDGIGAQDGLQWTEHYFGFSIIENQSNWDFTLTAPMQPGIYEVRFRESMAYDVAEAIACWWEVDSAPTWQATIGLVIVLDDQKNDPQVINDTNWKDWLNEKYVGNDLVVNDTTLLTADMVMGDDFWDFSKTTGKWAFNGNAISNQGTLRFNQYHQLVSKQSFEQFNLIVNEVYQHTDNLEHDWWSHSRGFGVLYYVNDQMNVEFRYFADIGQLTLYIRDHDKVVEYMKSAHFIPGDSIVNEISVVDGKIKWIVNDMLIFNKTTTLKSGRLMLTNHNNAVTFQF